MDHLLSIFIFCHSHESGNPLNKGVSIVIDSREFLNQCRVFVEKPDKFRLQSLRTTTQNFNILNLKFKIAGFYLECHCEDPAPRNFY